MLSEKDLIFFGAAMILSQREVTIDEAIIASVSLYNNIFGDVSDSCLKEKCSFQYGRKNRHIPYV